MAEKLSVEIGAEIDDLKKGLNQANNEVNKFGKNVDKNVSKLGKSTKNAGKGFKAVGKGAANAVPSVTEFSRVIQDAPFGIQGVANNIQQLTANFGHLTKSAGGVKNALRLMLKSLSGPAGILLVVSAVTAAMVFFRNSNRGAATDAEKLAKKNEEVANSLKAYKDGLDSLSKAQLKGSENAVKELTNLRLLNEQTNDSTLSNEKRTEAIDELRKKYPSYLQGMTDEKILTEGLKGTYDQLTTAILQKARAQAAASLIEANTKKELVLTSQLEVLALDNANKRLKRNAQSRKANNRQAGNLGPQLTKSKVATDGLTKSLEKEVELINQITALQQDSAKLAERIKENGGIVPLDFKADDAIGGIRNTLSLAGSAVQAGLTSIKTITNDPENQISLIPPPQFLTEDEVRLLDHMKRLEDGLSAFNTSAGELISNNIASTFSQLGSVIGASLATGGNVLKAAGQTLLAGLGKILVDLGNMAVKIGVGMLGIKAALKTLNPGVAIAAGVALIALGSAFSKGAKGMSGRIGSSGGGSSRGVADSGSSSRGFSSSSSTSGFSGGNGGTVVFEIAGTKLIGVLSNTLNRNKAIGGNFVLTT